MSDFPAPQSLAHIKHIVLVLSGKGGVGKSSVTTQLALSLVLKGFKVGVLDIDLTGPSIPRMFGLEGKKIFQSEKGWVPVQVDNNPNLSVISLGFLIGDRGNSVVWRGPRKTSMISQFITNVVWPKDLDYLIIDTPPGTSDEHISIAEQLKSANPDGGILVTQPQAISIDDVKKELNFCKKVNFKVLGVVENMSGYMCPCCGDITNIFGAGGGRHFAEQYHLKFLGALPMDPTFVEMIENNNKDSREADDSTEKSALLLDQYSKCQLKSVFEKVVENLLGENIPSRITT